MVSDLVLRSLREQGATSFKSLLKNLKISYPLLDSVIQQLRQELLVDVKSVVGQDYIFRLTSAGKHYAADRSETCRYAGPTPVALQTYSNVIRAQRAYLRPTPEVLRNAFSDLVIDDATIEKLGPALTSQRPLFLYGPSGNGKTSVAERLLRVLDDVILIPYAVEVDAQVISVFDPLVHLPVDSPPLQTIDPRWVACHRPFVMAAGELTPSMLNLQLDERSGVYAAPLQMKAANGVLLIDDFGRQAMSPRELLNRWILPLDRHVDYLSTTYGLTFRIPFELMLVFATNLDPSQLADEAFLRRVPNKIYLGPVSPEVFTEIFRRVLQEYGIPFSPEADSHLRYVCEKHSPNGLRACCPRDICEIMLATVEYQRRPFQLTPGAISRAAEIYWGMRAPD